MVHGFQSRWDTIQTGFVDEPRTAVQQADELEAQTIKQLAESFTAARNRLEEQWDRGDGVSTEDLRVALKKYRVFFQRLFSVRRTAVNLWRENWASRRELSGRPVPACPRWQFGAGWQSERRLPASRFATNSMSMGGTCRLSLLRGGDHLRQDENQHSGASHFRVR